MTTYENADALAQTFKDWRNGNATRWMTEMAAVNEWVYSLTRDECQAAYTVANAASYEWRSSRLGSFLLNDLSGRANYGASGRNPVTGQNFSRRYGGR